MKTETYTATELGIPAEVKDKDIGFTDPDEKGNIYWYDKDNPKGGLTLLGGIEPEAEKKEKGPTSFQEWNLAGGKAGTGKTYAEWLEKEEGEPTEKDAIADMKTELMKVRGADGYISPDDYKKAKEAWFQKGLNKDVFDENFEMFANPTHIGDYGITEY